jgi:hypothetical protein
MGPFNGEEGFERAGKWPATPGQQGQTLKNERCKFIKEKPVLSSDNCTVKP